MRNIKYTTPDLRKPKMFKMRRKRISGTMLQVSENLKVNLEINVLVFLGGNLPYTL